MSYAIQCCVRCSTLEDGHTDPGDRYLCHKCHVAGWRVEACGSLYQVWSFRVHTWDPVRVGWKPQGPPIEAADPRSAYLAAQQRHPGETVHVARVLDEPCSPGERAHA